MMAGKLEALRRLPGQRLLVLVGVLLLGTSAGAVPSPAAACTGCPMPLSEAVKDAAYGALVTVEETAPDGAYELRVDRVLRGAPPAQLVFGADPNALDLPTETQWIIFVFAGHGLDQRWVQAWRVMPDGSLVGPPTIEAPTTLSAFTRFFAPPSTTTSLPGDSRGSAPFVGALGALLGFGLWLARPRRGGRSTPPGA